MKKGKEKWMTVNDNGMIVLASYWFKEEEDILKTST